MIFLQCFLMMSHHARVIIRILREGRNSNKMVKVNSSKVRGKVRVKEIVRVSGVVGISKDLVRGKVKVLAVGEIKGSEMATKVKGSEMVKDSEMVKVSGMVKVSKVKASETKAQDSVPIPKNPGNSKILPPSVPRIAKLSPETEEFARHSPNVSKLVECYEIGLPSLQPDCCEGPFADLTGSCRMFVVLLGEMVRFLHKFCNILAIFWRNFQEMVMNLWDQRHKLFQRLRSRDQRHKRFQRRHSRDQRHKLFLRRHDHHKLLRQCRHVPRQGLQLLV